MLAGCSLETAIQLPQHLESNWLLLFDDADNTDATTHLRPPGNQGDILYTSKDRMRLRVPAGQTLPLNGMDKRDASLLLLKAAHLHDGQNAHQADEIVEELGFLALAIDQAGAYVRSGRCDIRDFLVTFKSHRKELMQNDAYRGASGTDQAVYTTWDLSYRTIEEWARSNGPSPVSAEDSDTALQILNVFPFFHYESSPESNLEVAGGWAFALYKQDTERMKRSSLPPFLFQFTDAGPWDNWAFRSGIQVLESFSLIRNDGSEGYSMHRLAHAWAFDRQDPETKGSAFRVAESILGHTFLGTELMGYNILQTNVLPHMYALQQHDRPFSVV